MCKFLLVLLFIFAPVSVRAENIELSADDGLEWDQRNQKIIMHRNAMAKTLTYTLVSDNIEALYKGANKKIYKIFANDNVKINSQTEQISTDKMVYDIDADKIDLFPVENPTVLTGSDSKIIANSDVVYFKSKNYATAKNAEILHSGRRLFADFIKITFENNGNKNEVKLVNADGNIHLIDGEEELFGDVAEYNPKNGYATITGNVYFKKGTQANLSGGRILYNMNTGVARILPSDAEGKVRGVFSTETTSKK